jgi:hypothetical protein
VAVDNSFHGRTFGALSVTGQEKYRGDFEPLLAGVRFVQFNDVEELRSAVDDDTCAILLEPIQGEGGICVSSPEFLQAAREAADRHRGRAGEAAGFRAARRREVGRYQRCPGPALMSKGDGDTFDRAHCVILITLRGDVRSIVRVGATDLPPLSRHFGQQRDKPTAAQNRR